MKKFCFTTTLLATSFMFADSGEDVAAAKKETAKLKAIAEQPHFIEYNNRMAVFGPFHQVYERTKPEAFYVGVEAWLVGAVSCERDNHATALNEAELRMGYNFFWNGRDHLTPFAGIGVIKDYSEKRSYSWSNLNGWEHYKHSKPAIGYGVVGFLYDHEFNRLFNLGTNLKLFVGGSSSHRHLSWGSPVYGVDLAVPITFRFGYKRHWDLRIEPFDIYLHGKEMARNYFGFRSTIGYRF
jgi:hypothetical protein